MFKRIIGLTGGIGSGKTTVSSYLANKYNLTVLDADIYAREAVAVGSSILTAIFTRYNDDRLMLDDGSLNRTALAEIIFNNSAEKQWLESQIHPYVRRHFEQELRNFKKNTVVLAIPLLFEANFTDLVTEIWVVYCDRPTQIARLQRRDRLTIQQAETRIDNQFPLAEKIKLADVVLDNSGNLQHLTQQIDRAIVIDG
jgi:dephospho-CoA kinase